MIAQAQHQEERRPESAAAEWVGPSDPQNDKLDLTRIRDSLPGQAAELKAMLDDARVRLLETRRRRASDEAASAQQWFQRLGWTVIAGSAVAALASGLVLYGQGAVEAPPPDNQLGLANWARDNLRTITVIQVIALFAATAAGAVLAARNYGRLWTEARRKAEADRIALVEAVLSLSSELPSTGPQGRLRQALEFFRRYQLDLQLGFYTRRAAEHAAVDTRAVWTAAGLAGITAVTGTLAALGSSFAVLAAFLGIAVPIVLSATRSWQGATRASEKAGSYVAARDALEEISQDLGAARTTADLGDAAAVGQFVTRVHEIMRTENGTWVGAGDVPNVAAAAGATRTTSAALVRSAPGP